MRRAVVGFVFLAMSVAAAAALIVRPAMLSVAPPLCRSR